MLGMNPLALLAISPVSHAYDGILHWLYGLDRQGWFLVLCGAVIAGFFCLRGFGSRSDY